MNPINRRLEILKEVLVTNNISIEKYTVELNKIDDNKVAIGKENDFWITYICKNSKKIELEKFMVFDFAVDNFLKRITDKTQANYLFSEYLLKIENIKHLLYQDEIEYSKKMLESLTDEKNIAYHKKNIRLNKKFLEKLNRPFNDSFLLPEWRKDGYFNSPEFKEIENKVELLLDDIGIPESEERDILKQEILKKEYNIDWVTLEHRFVPDAKIFID